MPMQLVKTVFEEEIRVPPTDLKAESDHRISNNLALVAGLLRLQGMEIAKRGRPLPAGEAKDLLEEMAGRVEAVSRLHRLLAASKEGPIELGPYIGEVANALVQNLAEARRVALSFEFGTACHLPAREAILVGLIVGELVTNAIKYAHPTGVAGHIALRCEGNAGAMLIEIADDGVGLPEGFDPDTDGGLGLRLVRSLASQLGARLTFDSGPMGLRVQIDLARPALA